MKTQEMLLKVSKDDQTVGYLYLPKHPQKTLPNLVKKTIKLSDLIDGYDSIPIYLDFDQDNELIGIEIVG